MSDSGPESGAKGVVEDIKGQAKEVIGEVTGDKSKEREGQAQQDKARSERDVAEHEAKAEAARSEAAVHEAEQGDVRLFLMNGVPLMVDGHHAAFRRVNESADPRSNMSVGGVPEPVEVDDEMLAVAEAVRPKLLADGMFLVGLDIVGNKLMEVNVFSPGGLGNCETLYGVKFTDAVIDALEHKVDLQGHYRSALENVDLATL